MPRIFFLSQLAILLLPLYIYLCAVQNTEMPWSTDVPRTRVDGIKGKAQRFFFFGGGGSVIECKCAVDKNIDK